MGSSKREVGDDGTCGRDLEGSAVGLQSLGGLWTRTEASRVKTRHPRVSCLTFRPERTLPTKK